MNKPNEIIKKKKTKKGKILTNQHQNLKKKKLTGTVASDTLVSLF